MPLRAKIDWDKARLHTQQVVLDHLDEHHKAIEDKDKRLSKKIKEAFIGKNTWSHHKVRLGRQTAATIWGVAKHAVPGGDVADKVLTAIKKAGQFLINRELSAGRDVSTTAKDLFDVEDTPIHKKMEQLFGHLESIVLWQREFEKTADKGITKTKQQVYLIECYTKLLTHYRDAAVTLDALLVLLRGEKEKIEGWHSTWSMEARATSPLFALENELLCATLFNPQVHNLYCTAEECYLSKDPVNAFDFYTQYIELEAIDAASFNLLSTSWFSEQNFAALLNDFNWFDQLRSMPTDADISVHTTRAQSGAVDQAISPEGWNSLMALKGSSILGSTFMTKTCLDELLKAKDWFARQVHRVTDAEVQTRTKLLKPAKPALDVDGWKRFSSIIGFRGSETEGVDGAYKAYTGLLGTQLAQFEFIADGQQLNTANRTKLARGVEDRILKLGALATETTRFIAAKSGSDSSKRRPFIQMLDTLVQRELSDLATVFASVDTGAGQTPEIDRAYEAYRQLMLDQAEAASTIDHDVASTNLDVRMGISESLNERAASLQTLKGALSQYIMSKLNHTSPGRRAFAFMFYALLRREEQQIEALQLVFKPEELPQAA